MTRYAGGAVLAEVVRSGFLEGVHRGSVVVLGPDSAVRHAAGDVSGPITRCRPLWLPPSRT